MLKKILPIILISLTVLAYADSFQKANQSFSKKEYKEAIELYQDDIKAEGYDVNTLFNLGNSYLNENRDGEALFTFYKASLLDPHDANIKKEINTLEEKLNLINQNRFPLVISNIENWIVSLSLLLIISINVFLLTLLYVKEKKENILYRIKKPLIITLLIMLIFSTIGNILYLSDKNSGIVLNKMDVLISPYTDSDASFTINQGTKITVDDSFKTFLFITDNNQRYGWIEKDNIGLLWE